MTTLFKPGRTGVEFKGGKLYDFSKWSVYVMKGWPDPRSWSKDEDKGWRQERKFADEVFCRFLMDESHRPSAEPPDVNAITLDTDADLVNPRWTPDEVEKRLGLKRWRAMRAWKDARAYWAFFDTIPGEIKDRLLRFEKRRWHVLNLLARCRGADDLIDANPALGFALASNWVFHQPAVKQPMRAARSLIRKKQRHILGWLGFPATESARRVLMKVVPSAVSVESLLYLRDALKNPVQAKRLAHVPRLNKGALRLACTGWMTDRLTPSLLEEVARDEDNDHEAHTYGLLRDALRMDRRMGGGGCPERFTCLNRLKDVHDVLSRELENLMAKDWLNGEVGFPDPPYAGTPWIQPISTPLALFDEGRIMHHCVASYGDNVVGGGVYIYRVLEPVRATLAIYRSRDGWDAGQMQLACNKRVPKEIKEQVVASLFSSPGWEAGQRLSKNPFELFPLPEPGVICNLQGEPVTELSPEMKAAVERIRAVFIGKGGAS
ncbi:MAG TPA: PcfJ domain-containing protein [Kiritimatiellia bacterium]|nr:PcfJ domain-containing protein [Kiritimatiellia bacterium]